jgi:hypothetical protein
MQALGRLGFSALARKLGFAGGGRRGALAQLAGRGKVKLPGTPLTREETAALYASVGLAGQEPTS